MRLPVAALAGLFFVSGAGALVIETTWLRWFRDLLGSAAPAASATLVAFLLGQGAGALLGATVSRRARRPLRAYAILEGIAVLGAAGVPVMLQLLTSVIDGAYREGDANEAVTVAARLLVALAATLPASIAFGATFPVLVAAASRRVSDLGRIGGTLYALNTAGAALGAFLATFLLPERFGVTGSHAIGCAALLTAAAGAWAFDLRAAAPDAAAPAREGGSRIAARFATLAALSGAGVFGSQVLLTQAFARVLNQSTFAFGAVLVTTLVALALGAASVTRWARRPERWLALCALGAALGLALFPSAFVAATDGLRYLGSDRAHPGYLVRAFALAALTVAPLLVAAGGVWPAILGSAGAVSSPAGAGAGSVAGRLLAWNTLGAVAGAVLAPWLLLPMLGLWGSVTAVAALYGVAALLAPGGGRALRSGALLAGTAAIGVFAPPGALPEIRLEPGDRILHQASGPAGLVAVIERGGGRLIQTDNHYALGGTRDRVRQQRQGHLPLLLHPDPKDVLFLGSATASSASAALAHDVESIVLVEIVPGVAHAAARWFGDDNGRVHEEPRARVVLDDARSYVRAARQPFDVIVADLFVPWRAGTGALYSRDHFEDIRARLRDGGVFCQWLALYQLTEPELQSILTTFTDVFPDAVVFRGDFFGSHPIVALVGVRNGVIDASATSRAAGRLGTRLSRDAASPPDRWVTHPFGPWALYAGPAGAVAAHWADAPRNTLDRPVVEFLAARQHAGGGAGQPRPFVGPALSQLGRALRESADAARLEPIRGFGPAERRAAEGGHALQTASALFMAGDVRGSGSALARAAALLPRDLLAEAPADPTAADVWHTDPR